MTVLRPAALADALTFRAETGALPFAGGTDLMVRHRAKNGLPPRIDGPVLFLDRVRELRTIVLGPEGLDIGAALPMAVLAGDPGERDAWLQREFGGGSSGEADAARAALAALPEVLVRAAAELGAPALRQRATLAGNAANASPAGDTLAALYALGGLAVLTSVRGTRVLDIGEFVTGPGRTVLADDEIITALRIPAPMPQWCFWRKVGTRRANALTKVSLAASAVIGGGRIVRAVLAFGAVGPTVVRPAGIGAILAGLGADDLTGEGSARTAARLAEVGRKDIHPIDDQRSTARYRKTVALNLIVPAIDSLARRIKEYST